MSLETKEKNTDDVKEPKINDFVMITKFDQGKFSDIHLSYIKQNPKKLFVVKVLQAERFKWKNLAETANGLNRIAEISKSPYIAELYYYFQNNTSVIFVKEYFRHGDLKSLLDTFGSFDFKTVNFFSAEVLLAISYLHRNDIIHRDVTPDNLLVTSRGHLCLSDTGLDSSYFYSDSENVTFFSSWYDGIPPASDSPLCFTSVNGSQSSTIVRPSNRVFASFKVPTRLRSGSLNYLAPELLICCSHGFEVDYWSLGVCMFQLVTGRLPFPGDTPQTIITNIINNAEQDIEWPNSNEDISYNAAAVIRTLLARFPDGRANEEMLKRMDFYKDINWDSLYSINPSYLDPLLSSNRQPF